MRKIVKSVITALLLLFIIPVSGQTGQSNPRHETLPFRPGEKLTYEISWSSLVRAGTAVMEVRQEQAGGRTAYRLISRAWSSGLLSKFYKVSDTVESIIDGRTLCSLSFRLDQRHGKRKKKREMSFDHEKGVALVANNGRQETYAVEEGVQDALSSLYYIRTRRDFIVGKPIIVNVHEDGKTWAVEIHTVGREKVSTPVGDFNTIRIRTCPKYEGVFQNKGEIDIWLTDDDRRIPVLMKSTISIGSIVSRLVGLESGETKK